MRLPAVLLGALLLGGAPLTAQTGDEAAPAGHPDSLRARFYVPEPPRDWGRDLRPHASPSLGANSPVAFGGRTGDVFAAASATARARQVQAVDGSYAVGFALGDPDRLVSLDVAVISFSSFRSGFWKRGAIDLQLSRSLPSGFSVAAGWEAPVTWGATDGGSSRYVALSKWTPLRERDDQAFSAVMLTAGIGDGRFQSIEAFSAGENGVGVFGSVGIRVAAPLAVVADWTGQDLTALVSVAPFRRLPLSLSFGMADLTGRVGETPRFVASGGVGLNLGELF